MAELPEIAKYTAQMDATLAGKVLSGVEITQPKSTNLGEAEFNARVAGAVVARAYYRGKWILLELGSGDTLLLNVGMGADVLFQEPGVVNSDKWQARIGFTDGSAFTVRFWWIGKLLLVRTAELGEEPLIKDVALDPFSPKFTLDYFRDLLRGQRTGVKAFILNQKRIGGIGNMYVHDILFEARLHPLTKISVLSDDDVERIYDAIQLVLRESAAKGTFAFERDFFGEHGGWGGEGSDDFRVGYREGEPCPVCGTTIIALKTGSNTGYLCPNCQPVR
ncbi:MAG: hypothetical protein FWG11_08465 [Promicromonosporaceae bacterium]|nr:hypothetical protein [Promicromonosporaceae bacterium]